MHNYLQVDIGTAANSILTARQKDHERACKAKEEASKKPIEEVMAAMAEKNDVWRKKHEVRHNSKLGTLTIALLTIAWCQVDLQCTVREACSQAVVS